MIKLLKLQLILIVSVSWISVSAQFQPPNPNAPRGVPGFVPSGDPRTEQMTHAMSEFYEPATPVVTPGDISAHSAPSDAIILFDGTDLSAFKDAWTGGEPEWIVNPDKTVTVGKGSLATKQDFENFQLHLEWYVSAPIDSGQNRGNSGIYLQGKYELQILDSYDNETYVNGQCASIYKQIAPLVNAVRKPGEWNVFDIIYHAPVFKADGTYRYQPTVTVMLNNVLVIDNFSIVGTTEYVGFPKVVEHGPGPVMIQNHGTNKDDPMRFRNMWIRIL